MSIKMDDTMISNTSNIDEERRSELKKPCTLEKDASEKSNPLPLQRYIHEVPIIDKEKVSQIRDKLLNNEYVVDADRIAENILNFEKAFFKI